MKKRKIFPKTDLKIPHVEYEEGISGYKKIRLGILPPENTQIEFGDNCLNAKNFDFREWYGVGFDPITYACQKQIERFLVDQEADVEKATIVGYCRQGLRYFLRFLKFYLETSPGNLELKDVNRDLVNKYIVYLNNCSRSKASQKTTYSYTKSVLIALGRRSILKIIDRGGNATFPDNPFPESSRTVGGETPLTKKERTDFANALKKGIQPMFLEDAVLDSELCTYAYLLVALLTGRNKTPILEMDIDCLQPHPKYGLEFLRLIKRRGYTSQKVALRVAENRETEVDETAVSHAPLSRVIRRVIELTSEFRIDVPDALRSRLWLYRSHKHNPSIKILKNNVIDLNIKKLLNHYSIKSETGDDLRINIGRLRKTFVNRVFELSNGDIATTAVAAGNSPEVAAEYYLRPTLDQKRNWVFMGKALVDELKENTIGATDRTPVGKCSDPQYGEYAPKRDGKICQSFLNCLRCRNYVVTGDDLWRLFSFYYRVIGERARMDKGRWSKSYAHIPRMIQRDVIEEGLRRNIFKPDQVKNAKERARIDPHPFWVGFDVFLNVISLHDY